MKKINFVFVAILLASVYSCDGGNDVVYIPFQSEENGRWGLISQDGEVLFEEEFENAPSTPVNGRFFVYEKDGYSIYTVEEKPQLIGEKFIGICPYTANVTLAVKENQRISIIDKDGNVVTELEKIGGKEILTAEEFREGLSVIKTEDGYGCINTDGKVVIQPKWAKLNTCSEGILIGISKKDAEGDEPHAISFINKKGEVLYRSNKIELAHAFKYGRIAYSKGSGKDERCGFMDKDGNEILKATSKIHGIFDWDKDNFIYRSEDGKFGLMDMDGQVLIRAKYDFMFYATNDLLYAFDDNGDEISLINTNGDKLSEDTFKDTYFSYEHNFIGAVAIADNEWIFIDKSGKDLKIKKDIYRIQHNVQSAGDIIETANVQTVNSDYFDVEGLVSNLEIKGNSIIGLEVDKTTLDCITYFNTLNGNNEEPEANDYTSRWSLSSTKEYKDYEIAVRANFKNSLASSSYKFNENTWEYDYSYNWNEQLPQSINVEISGYDLNRRLDTIFDAIMIKLGVAGKISKKEDNLAVVKLKNGYYIVTKNYSSITIKFTRDDPQDQHDYDYDSSECDYDSSECDYASCEEIVEEVETY